MGSSDTKSTKLFNFRVNIQKDPDVLVDLMMQENVTQYIMKALRYYRRHEKEARLEENDLENKKLSSII